MSIKIMSRVWDAGPLMQSERFVLLALADYANDAGECWPSISAIGSKVCLSERAVQTVIRRLEAGGWLAIQTGNGRRGCNQYLIKTPQHLHPAASAPPPQQTAQTPQQTAQNPAASAPEPSRTIIEPSVVLVAPKKERPRRRIPENWTPSDRNIADAEARQFSAKDIHREADRFRDYHRSKGTTFADWDAGWRTWLGNARQFGPKPDATIVAINVAARNPRTPRADCF